MSIQSRRILGLTRAMLGTGLLLVLVASRCIGQATDKSQDLIRASSRGDLQEVTRLLNNGADVNAKDEDAWTPLGRAAAEGHFEVAKALLDKGADINAKEEELGWTPLMWAAERGHVEVVKLLLDTSVDVNGRDEGGETALMHAAAGGKLDVVKLLLDKGAEVNAEAGDGWTALMDASERGRLEVVKLLLEGGADVNSKDKGGRTALELARQKDHKEIQDLLKAHGAEDGEAQLLTRFEDKVSRRGDELFFRLKDNTVISRKNARWDDSGSKVDIVYTFHDFIVPWYVIRVSYYEGGGTEFINRENGAVVNVDGHSEFSPDKARFLAVGYPGESPCDAEIWKLSAASIVKEWVMDQDAAPYDFRWTDPVTVEITRDDEVIAHVRYEGTMWKCSGTLDVCNTAGDKLR